MRTTDITHAPGYKVYVKGVPASKTLLDVSHMARHMDSFD